jgi:hypothetical protein
MFFVVLIFSGLEAVVRVPTNCLKERLLRIGNVGLRDMGVPRFSHDQNQFHIDKFT